VSITLGCLVYRTYFNTDFDVPNLFEPRKSTVQDDRDKDTCNSNFKFKSVDGVSQAKGAIVSIDASTTGLPAAVRVSGVTKL
jgi:hypothetical protein